jgi:hypothetical protein
MIILALLCSISWAQRPVGATVPNVVRYGGTLKDAQGALLPSTTEGVTFAIYRQQEGGAPIWIETQNVASDASGQYSVLLGGNSPSGLPSDLFSQEEQRWLGVTVQGQAEQPRVLLVSVPYALRAHDAETLAGRSISDFVLAKDVGSSATTTNATTLEQTTASASEASTIPSHGGRTGAASQGPTNFSGSTTNQIVGISQAGTGLALIGTVPNGIAIDAQVTASTSPNSDGIFGTVQGLGTGVFGNATSPSGWANGVQGNTSSTTGIGVVALASATSGNTYGVRGYATSTSGTGVGGLANAVSGSTYGVSGAVASPSGTGVWGQAQASSGGTGVWGQSSASSGGTGVWGQSSATTGAGAGVLATAASSSGSALSASESSTTGLTFGVKALVASVGGVAGWFQNTANGALIAAASGGGNTQVTEFVVDGGGDVTGMGYFNAGATYQIQGIPVLSIGVPVGSQKNLFLGRHAGPANSGDLNLFVGEDSGFSNTSGTANAFVGVESGYSNITGNNNSYLGFQSGFLSGGNNNTYLGFGIAANSPPGGDTGSNNTYVGYEAGYANTTGSNNTYLGYLAGVGNSAGSNNIYVGSQGVISDNNIIRIGTQGTGNGQQNAAYMAGVYTSTVSGVPVYVTSNGQLGVLSSSRRFKQDIRNIGDSSDNLMRLRPVSFFYKPEYANGPQTLQYGLIAEEVAKVYPELVEFSENGEPYTVRYNLLISMMLNELQKQYHQENGQSDTINQQDETIERQRQQIEELQKQNSEMQQRLSRLEMVLLKQNAALVDSASPETATTPSR